MNELNFVPDSRSLVCPGARKKNKRVCGVHMCHQKNEIQEQANETDDYVSR